MRLTLEEIRRKEVVNIIDGTCFGFADDVAIDTETKKIVEIIIRGRLRLFGLLGKEEDISIGWNEIDTIGRDIILVKTERKGKMHNRKDSFLQKFFNIFF
ncbi:MAG: YlmC/YmxH family sporulation protein [Oscillospiraceae bacterium]|nr:YlmC/YmxH family sporulation protein [Oscillospiraceae bacterium]